MTTGDGRNFTAVNNWSIPRITPCGDLDEFSLQSGFNLEDEVSMTQGLIMSDPATSLINSGTKIWLDSIDPKRVRTNR